MAKNRTNSKLKKINYIKGLALNCVEIMPTDMRSAVGRLLFHLEIWIFRVGDFARSSWQNLFIRNPETMLVLAKRYQS
jgi:hypothetical protein